VVMSKVFNSILFFCLGKMSKIIMSIFFLCKNQVIWKSTEQNPYSPSTMLLPFSHFNQDQ
jgi:hypothetical protein